IVPLTYDTDNVYEQLLALDAAGGGDTPESVNLALSDAVGEMNWRDGQRVYKTIFLVGDCPPHMDYRNEVKYPETCKKASEKGIIINAIKLGDCHNPHFRKIAALSQGEFLQLAQNADDVVIQTPYDDSIQAVSYAIEDSKIYYGDQSIQQTALQRKEKSKQLYGKSSKNSISTRASYNMSKAGKKNWFGEQELLNDIIDEKVSIDSIDKDLLPNELKGLNNEALKNKVEKKVNDRHVQMEKLSYLNQQRQLYIQEQLAKDTTHTSFSEDVYKAIKKQAAKSDIKLEGKVKH
ncbi:MAG: hypothetical protein MI922_00255, partial [Bacteroidales bacterium]|nr:hypothetical protein [Bacteroidales bacterium]